MLHNSKWQHDVLVFNFSFSSKKVLKRKRKKNTFWILMIGLTFNNKLLYGPKINNKLVWFNVNPCPIL